LFVLFLVGFKSTAEMEELCSLNSYVATYSHILGCHLTQPRTWIIKPVLSKLSFKQYGNGKNLHQTYDFTCSWVIGQVNHIRWRWQ